MPSHRHGGRAIDANLVFRATIMGGKMSSWIAKRRISQIIMVILTLFLAGNFTYANTQTKNDKKKFRGI
jgi:hypothetical protein